MSTIQLHAPTKASIHNLLDLLLYLPSACWDVVCLVGVVVVVTSGADGLCGGSSVEQNVRPYIKQHDVMCQVLH